MKVVTAREMQALDRRTIEDVGIPGVVLMENAGRKTAELILEHFGPSPKEVVVLAGRGNNGGDGFVVARYLKNWGWPVKVLLFAQRERVSGDARVNLEVWVKIGGELMEIKAEADLDAAKGEMARAGLIVDALLGTGLNSEVRGLLRRAIEEVNALSKPVVAVDVPSGIDASTGRVLGVAVRADLTATFGLAKVGQVVHPGVDYVGRLEVIDISIPPEAVEEAGIRTYLLEPEELDLRPLSRRPRDTHKGTYGHLLLVVGSPGKTGAAAMASEAALRMGVGLATLACPASLNPIMEVKLTEAMTEPVPEDEGTFSPRSLPRLMGLLEGKDALALGPGVGTREGTKEVVLELLRAAAVPVVVDADGINCLVGSLDVLKERRAPLVLTPHPGEMARLLGVTPREVQGDRIGVARRFAEGYGCVLVLKGARTVIASPEGLTFINPTGNPGMASGGTGDVLTGMIGALLAQGMEPLEAAKLAVYLHGLSGDLAAEEVGEVALVATDLLRCLPKAIKELQGGGHLLQRWAGGD